MAKANTLGELNEELFAQLKRLTADDMDREAITAEIERSRAVSSLAGAIINNGKLILQAQQTANDAKEARRLDDVARKMLN